MQIYTTYVERQSYSVQIFIFPRTQSPPF